MGEALLLALVASTRLPHFNTSLQSRFPALSRTQDFLLQGDSCHTGRRPRWGGRFGDGRVGGQCPGSQRTREGGKWGWPGGQRRWGEGGA